MSVERIVLVKDCAEKIASHMISKRVLLAEIAVLSRHFLLLRSKIIQDLFPETQINQNNIKLICSHPNEARLCRACSDILQEMR